LPLIFQAAQFADEARRVTCENLEEFLSGRADDNSAQACNFAALSHSAMQFSRTGHSRCPHDQVGKNCSALLLAWSSRRTGTLPRRIHGVRVGWKLL